MSIPNTTDGRDARISMKDTVMTPAWLRSRWEGSARLLIIGATVLTVITVALLGIMNQAASSQRDHKALLATTHQQVDRAHRLAAGSLALLGGDSSGVDVITAAVTYLDEAHYALRYGNEDLGVPETDNRSVVRSLAALEPAYLDMRSAAEQLRITPADLPAAERLVQASQIYRDGLVEVVEQLEADQASSAETWRRIQLSALGIAFVAAIAALVVVPALTRSDHASPHQVIEPTPDDIDHLTGLPRRVILHDRLDVAISRAVAKGGFAAVLMIDINQLRKVNARHGHAAGDRILQELATRIKARVRAGDTVARLEEDHFAVLLEDIHRAEDAAIVADKILEVSTEPMPLSEIQHAGIAIGIAVAPIDSRRADNLLEQAEIALHAAKRVGRPTFHYYSPELRFLVHSRLEMMDGLRRAIANKRELRLAYQPKINIATGRLAGVEALIRWHHPELGEMLPDEFVPLAEETDLILEMEQWVLETACVQAASWQLSQLGPLPVSVNVSARQFRNGDLTSLVSDILDRTGLAPEMLEIELTERVLMNDTELSRTTLTNLQRLGVSIAIDDFGTGYSSLSYLKRFPIDALKIDRTFIGELAVGPNDTAISTAIIALAHSLDLNVIAEGVETIDQLSVLRTLGCDQGQGYLFAEALSPDALEGFAVELPRIVAAIDAASGRSSA